MVVAGDKIRASDILKRCGVRVRRAAVQNIANNTATSVSWDTEDEDTDGFITVTGTTVTIPAGLGGVYAITVNADPTGTINNRLLVDLVLTSPPTGTPTTLRQEGNTPQTVASASWTLPLDAGTSFVVQFFHTHGSAVDFVGWLSCYRVQK